MNIVIAIVIAAILIAAIFRIWIDVINYKNKEKERIYKLQQIPLKKINVGITTVTFTLDDGKTFTTTCKGKMKLKSWCTPEDRRTNGYWVVRYDYSDLLANELINRPWIISDNGVAWSRAYVKSFKLETKDHWVNEVEAW